ncbi:MAG: HAD-IA family hydrolase [Betaproteobacteria bacterium]|jgi:phosphoglycolate phosphatase
MQDLNYDMIIWDWDGTLMNSTPTIVDCMQKSCMDLGMPIPSNEIASHVIGLGLHDAVKIAIPSISESEYELVSQRFRHYYLKQEHDLVLFLGVRELLEELKKRGHILAVATGKPRLGLNRSLEKHQLGHLFNLSRTADETKSKPHPQMLLELLDQTGIPAHRSLMIGDTTHDLLMAKQAGVPGLAVAYGAHPESQLLSYEPVACFREVKELSKFLLSS